LLAAQTALATAQLQAEALSAKFVQSQQANSAATGLETLTPAGPAGNNRSSVAQKAALLGLFAGLVLGALLSYLIEVRRKPKFSEA
jgi:membrane associated rhomboid family serine protease